MYKINYGTGAGTEEAGTLEEAKAAADKDAAYTQVSIVIEDDNGNVVARRPWWSVKFDPEIEEDDDIIDFDDFGYFGAWVV